MEEAPDHLPRGPRAEPSETSVLTQWAQAGASLAARLARVTGRLGTQDDRLFRGPEGRRHRLALIENVQDDAGALARVGWAVRRLTRGPGPEPGLVDFLGRHDPKTADDVSDRFADRAECWLDLMQAPRALHPIARADMGLNLWSLAGLGHSGDRMEAADTVGRIAASEAMGAAFAPLAMGRGRGLARVAHPPRGCPGGSTRWRARAERGAAPG